MIHVLKYDVEFTEYIYLGAYLLQKFHQLSVAEAEKTKRKLEYSKKKNPTVSHWKLNHLSLKQILPHHCQE